MNFRSYHIWSIGLVHWEDTKFKEFNTSFDRLTINQINALGLRIQNSKSLTHPTIMPSSAPWPGWYKIQRVRPIKKLYHDQLDYCIEMIQNSNNFVDPLIISQSIEVVHKYDIKFIQFDRSFRTTTTSCLIELAHHDDTKSKEFDQSFDFHKYDIKFIQFDRSFRTSTTPSFDCTITSWLYKIQRVWSILKFFKIDRTSTQGWYTIYKSFNCITIGRTSAQNETKSIEFNWSSIISQSIKLVH